MPAPSAISQTGIINKAQILLGQSKRFTELLDTDHKAIDYQTLWPMALPKALVLHPWNFAIRRKRINADTVAPEFGYAYRYRLPSDCLRFLPWSRDDDAYFEHEIEDGYVLTDQPSFILIRYIYRNEDLAKWSPLFADVMAYALAMESCEGSTSKRGLYEDLKTERDDLIATGKRLDALENGNRRAVRPMTASSWASARYRRNGWQR